MQRIIVLLSLSLIGCHSLLGQKKGGGGGPIGTDAPHPTKTELTEGIERELGLDAEEVKLGKGEGFLQTLEIKSYSITQGINRGKNQREGRIIAELQLQGRPYFDGFPLRTVNIVFVSQPEGAGHFEILQPDSSWIRVKMLKEELPELLDILNGTGRATFTIYHHSLYGTSFRFYQHRERFARKP